MVQQKEIQTRLNEQTLRSSDPKKIAGKFLYKDAKRTWIEDFTDEDTGEIISIERNEIIMKRGTELTPDRVSELSFFFQSGDLKEVEVTSQRRPGNINDYFSPVLFEATIYRFPAGTAKYLLHAENARQAYDIIEDYLELFSPGQNTIRGLRAMGDYTYIRPNKETDEDVNRGIVPFYKAQGAIIYTDEDHDITNPAKLTCKYVLQADDVKEANDIIKQRLAATEKKMHTSGQHVIKTTTIAAQPYPIVEITPRAFCEAYIERDRNK